MKNIFQQLTLEERERIYALREQGKSWRLSDRNVNVIVYRNENVIPHAIEIK